MKVAIGYYGVRDDIGGVGTWLLDLIKFLQAREARPVVLLQSLDGELNDVPIYRQCRRLCIEVEMVRKPNFTEDVVKNTLEFLNRHRPDVFVPQCLPGFHYAASFAAKAGLPWVYTLHSDDSDYWGLAAACGPSAEEGHWVAVSNLIAQEVASRYPDAICQVIPCGVKIPNKKAQYQKAPFRVAYSGRVIEFQKRVSLIVQIFIEACRISECIEGVIIGDGPELKRMKALVATANLGTRILFRGRLDPGDVQMELLNCQAILLMSDFEGLPVALMEAMAAGVVPVTRAIRSGIPEIVIHEKTGVLVEAHPADAARTLTCLAGDRARWERLSDGACQLVTEKFAQEQCHEKWIQALNNLCSQSKPKFPMALPRNLRLPPVHPLLAGIDGRRPGLAHRVGGKIRRMLNG